MVLREWEHAVKQSVYLISYLFEVFWVVLVVDAVNFDGQDFTFIFIVYEVFVEVVQTLEVLELDGLFAVSTAFLDVCDEVWDAGTQVNHEIGIADNVRHMPEEFHICLEIPVAQVAHLLVVGSEDIDAFIY